MQLTESNSTENENAKGISWWLTGLFIAGGMAGAGLVAMPAAMVAADWKGAIAVIVLGALFSGYTGVQLGQNWIMLQERWPEYEKHCMNPYSAIGYRAIGPKFKHVVTICLLLTQFGIAVVLLLLSAKNIHHFLKAIFQVNLNFCFLIIVVAVFLLPIAMLKNLKDSRQVLVSALLATSGAVILISVGSLADASTCKQEARFPPVTFNSFFLAFGTILFAYGGHAVFPYIQQDMKNPRHFSRAVILGYSIVVSMYVPVSMLGYATYGDSLRSSVIQSIQIKWLQQTTNVLMTMHIILIMTMMFHPVNEQLEAVLKLPQTFGWERVLVRTATIVAIVFVAETVPNFGAVLHLFGGSTITLMTIIFPSLANLFLAAAAARQETNGSTDSDYRATLRDIYAYTPPLKLTANMIVIAFGLIGGAAATWASMEEIVATDFAMPCYVMPFISSTFAADTTHTFCCGPNQNISRYGNNFTDLCVDPDID